MPTIVYTPEEQSKIDSFNLAITNAQKALATANGNVTASYNSMNNAFSAGGLAPGCYNGQSSLQAQIAAGGPMDKNSCKTYPLSSIHKCSSCESSVAAFNQTYSNWMGAKSVASKAQTDLTTANSNLQNYLNTITSSPDVASQIASNTAAATAAQKVQQSKWILFGLIAIGVIVAAGFALKMIMADKN